MTVLYRTDQARIQVNVSGITMPTDSWSKMDGGDNQAETQQILPGGMQPARALGGPAKRSNLTVERPWSDAMTGLYKQLDQASGSAEVTVTYTVLDAKKNPVPGAGITYSGILKSVARPNYDSESANPAMLQIVVECHEDLG